MSLASYLTFGLAGTAYAIPLTRVREVVGCRAVVRVPNAGDAARGVMNLRGAVVPVIDFAQRLGLGSTTLSETSCAVLVDSTLDGDHGALAGLVEEIHNVIELSAEEVVSAPAFGLPIDPRLVRGIALHGDRFACVLDLDQVLAVNS